jgi:hypothetical protein
MSSKCYRNPYLSEMRTLIPALAVHSPVRKVSSKGRNGVVWEAASKGPIVIPGIRIAAPHDLRLWFIQLLNSS